MYFLVHMHQHKSQNKWHTKRLLRQLLGLGQLWGLIWNIMDILDTNYSGLLDHCVH